MQTETTVTAPVAPVTTVAPATVAKPPKAVSAKAKPTVHSIALTPAGKAVLAAVAAGTNTTKRAKRLAFVATCKHLGQAYAKDAKVKISASNIAYMCGKGPKSRGTVFITISTK